MKATISGVQVEGTPKEIAELVDLLDKPKASTTGISIDGIQWYPQTGAAVVPYGNWRGHVYTYI